MASSIWDPAVGRRLIKEQGCPICEHHDWCQFSADEKMVVCVRYSGHATPLGWKSVKESNSGGWIYAREDGQTFVPSTPRPTPKIEVPTDIAHSVYSAFLDQLDLRETHRDIMRRKRAFADEDFSRFGAKSTPRDDAIICERLISRFGKDAVLKVPGFYEEAGRVRINPFGGASGLYLPSFDGERITGLRYAPDVVREGSPKYSWATSSTHDGPSAVVRPSVYKPTTDKGYDNIIITEGEFKAYITAKALGWVTLSVPGVGVWKTAKVIDYVYGMGAKRAFIAYDIDTNPKTRRQVNIHKYALADALVAKGVEVYIMTWPTEKGIDDFLLNHPDDLPSYGKHVVGMNGVPVTRILTEEDLVDETYTSNRDLQSMGKPTVGKYLPVITSTKKVVMIKSPKGSGKTTMMARRFGKKQRADSSLNLTMLGREDLLHIANGDQSALVLGHRRSLLHELSASLGVENYLNRTLFAKGDETANRKALTAAKRLAICLDSLPKLLKPEPRDVVFIDEIAQVLRHLKSDTLADKRYRVFIYFCQIIRMAKQVVLTDADLDQTTYDFILSVVGNPDDIEVVVNTVVRKDAPPIYAYEGTPEAAKSRVLADMTEKVNDGKPVYLATNSKSEALKVERMFQTRFPDKRILCITSLNSNDEDIQELLSELKAHVKDYDILIASPSLNTGIDINVEWFDYTYSIVMRGSTTARDALQHIARNRQAKEIHVWVDPTVSYAPTLPEDLKANCLKNAYEVGKRLNSTELNLVVSFDAEGNEIITDESEGLFLDLWAAITADDNTQTNNLDAAFFDQAEKEGHEIHRINCTNVVKEIAAAKKEAKAELEAEYLENVLTAETIGPEEAYKIEKALRTTKPQRFSLEKYNIATYYGTEPTEPIVKFDDMGMGRILLANYMLYRGYLDASAFDARELTSVIGRREFTDVLHNFVGGVEMRNYLINKAGLAITQEDIIDATSLRLSGFDKWAWEHRSDIQRLLNISVRSDVERKPIILVSDILRQIGVKLTARKKEGTILRYGIGQTSVQQMETFSSLRRAVLGKID